MTGYISILRQPTPLYGSFKRDSSKDISIPANGHSMAVALSGRELWVSWGTDTTQEQASGGIAIKGFDVSGVPSEIANSSFTLFGVGNQPQGASIINNLMFLAAFGNSNLSLTSVNISRRPPDTAGGVTLRVSARQRATWGVITKGNIIWTRFFSPSAGWEAFDLIRGSWQRATSLRFNPRDISATVRYGFYNNNKIYLFSGSGYMSILNVSSSNVVTLESQSQLTLPSDVQTIRGVTGNSANLWMAVRTTSSEDKVIHFTTGTVEGSVARTPIDTIFYTDKDRHKIYPKKCWIVQKSSDVLSIQSGTRAVLTTPFDLGYAAFAYESGLYIHNRTIEDRSYTFKHFNVLGNGNLSAGSTSRELDTSSLIFATAVMGHNLWIFGGAGSQGIAYDLSATPLLRSATLDIPGVPANVGNAFIFPERNLLCYFTFSAQGVACHYIDISTRPPSIHQTSDTLSPSPSTSQFNFFVRGDIAYAFETPSRNNANGVAKAWSISSGRLVRDEPNDISFINVSTSSFTSVVTDDKIYALNTGAGTNSAGVSVPNRIVDLYRLRIQPPTNPFRLVPWYTKDTSIPVISAFQSAPSEIDEDASPPTNITLTWRTSGTVTRERMTDLHRNQNVPLSGNNRAVVARPLANTVYSLVATNGNFGSTTAKITVPVFKDCVINSFTVQYITNPLSPHGATVYFNINVTGKPRPTVSIDNGVGGANTHLTYDEDTGVLSGRIVHTFAGPRTFTATLTANNTQANGVAGPAATRTVQVIIP